MSRVSKGTVAERQATSNLSPSRGSWRGVSLAANVKTLMSAAPQCLPFVGSRFPVRIANDLIRTTSRFM
jgi:hypothetical protein